MRIGIDLGGTKIEAIALADDGRVMLQRRIASPARDYHAIIAAIADLVDEFERELGCACPVGLGTPGAPSVRSGLMKNSNTTVINGRPLQADLEQALGREVRLSNDANCFALSEAVDGAGAGVAVVFGVILGTGVGGGLVMRGQSLQGKNFLAGEWGHNPLPGAAEQRECYCGHRDCIETYLSGPGLLRSAQQLLPQVASTAALVQMAQEGSDRAQALLNDYSVRLATALAGVVNILDPDVIVLGGGLSNIDAIYPQVNEQLAACVFGGECQTRVVKATHGDASGVRGAAWLWPGTG